MKRALCPFVLIAAFLFALPYCALADEGQRELRVYDIRDLITVPEDKEETKEMVMKRGEALRAFIAHGSPAQFALTELPKGAKDEPLSRMFFRGGNPGDMFVIATRAEHAALEETLQVMRKNMGLSVKVEVHAFVFKKDAIQKEEGAFYKATRDNLRLQPEELQKLREAAPLVAVTARPEDAKTLPFDTLMKAAQWHKEETVSISLATPVGSPESFANTHISASPHWDRRGSTVSLTVGAFKEGAPPFYIINIPVGDGCTAAVVDDGPITRSVAGLWVGEQEAKRLDLQNSVLVILVRPCIVIATEEEARGP
jgi:hypothetical protein